MKTTAASSLFQERKAIIPRLTDDGKAIMPLKPIQVAARDKVAKELANGKLSLETAQCLCGRTEADATLVARKDRYGLPMGTWICPCGLGYTSPRMDGASLGRFYDRYYRELYSASKHPTEQGWQLGKMRAKAVMEFVRARGAVADGAKWADIGCGNGSAASFYAEAGFAVSGCDMDSDVMARGRSEGLDLRVGQVEVLADAGPFDVITVNHVLEHVVDPGKFLADAAKLLAPEGVLYIEVPGLDNLYRHYGDLGRALQSAHLWHFNVDTLAWLAAPAGLEIDYADRRVRALLKPASARVAPESGLGPRMVQHVRRYERWMPLRRMASKVLRRS